MSERSYDDDVLEVATELELTTEQGDFIDILLNAANRKWNAPSAVAGWGNWGKYQRPDGKGGTEMALGEEVDFTIDLKTSVVLASRNVAPEDVVSLLSAGDGRRSAEVVDLAVFGKCFRLRQRQIVDPVFARKLREFMERLLKFYEGMGMFIQEAASKAASTGIAPDSPPTAKP